MRVNLDKMRWKQGHKIDGELCSLGMQSVRLKHPCPFRLEREYGGWRAHLDVVGADGRGRTIEEAMSNLRKDVDWLCRSGMVAATSLGEHLEWVTG